MTIGNCFDQSRELQPPDPRDLNSHQIRQWENQVRKYATPAQLAGLKTNYGYELPPIQERFLAGKDGLAGYGTESTGKTYAQLYGPEQAQREYEAVQKAIAKREADAAAQAAEQAVAERARQAASAEAFRAYHKSLKAPQTNWSDSPGELRIQYAKVRGYLTPTACGFSDQATVDKVCAELSSPAFHSAWGRGL